LQHPESNKRDKLVVISAKGREVQALTAKHFKTIESKMAINIGRDKVELLREQLLKNRAKIDKQTQA